MDKKIDFKNSNVLDRLKLPFLIFILGIILMVFPVEKKQEDNIGSEPTVSQILSTTKGVGACKVLLSDNGAVIVCEGADNAKVRLEIIQAINSYTGYGSDRITILKMAEQA